MKHIGFKGYIQLIDDCGNKSSQDKLVRDFSDIKRLAEELDILSEVNFEFEGRNSY